MPNKKIMSDVVIRVHKKPPVAEVFHPPVEEPVVLRPVEEEYVIQGKVKSLKFPVIILGSVLMVAVLFLTQSAYNARMVVNLIPNALSIAVDKNIVLSSTGAAAGSVPFITGILDYDDSGVFEAEESKVSEMKAEGKVVIYNKASKDAQILVASTRLQSPEGKIFRIPAMVVIPGFTIVGGKTVPGSKEVRVVADQPGADYNIGLTDFTIPGFKDSPKFITIYARSKTEMTGGFKGATKIVSKNAYDKAVVKINESANKKLKNIISKEVLKDQMLLPGSEEFVAVNIESSPKVGEAAEKFELKVKGKIRWATVKKKDLAGAMLKNGSEQEKLGTQDIQIANQDALAFKINGYQYDAASFNLNVKGNARIMSFLEPVDVKKQIVEKRLSNASEILSLFPGASRAEVRFQPVWTASLPMNFFNPASRPDHIDITIESR